jgi:hypothetical protein
MVVVFKVVEVVIGVDGGYVMSLDSLPSFFEGLRSNGLDVNLSGGLFRGVVRCDGDAVCEEIGTDGSDD